MSRKTRTTDDKKKRRELNRRHFLQAIGATALTYPFVRGLPGYASSTQTPDAVRMVLVFTPCGVVRHKWGAIAANPTPTGGPVVASPLQFRETLAPLAPLMNKTIVLDGLSAKAANGSHEAGMAALWTGTTSSGEPATGPSIDQVIANGINAGRAFKSIELMVRHKDDWNTRESKTRMIYSGPGAFLDPHDNPITARSTFFPNTPTGGMTGPDKKTFIRSKLFGRLNDELSAMQPRLCTEDRQTLEALQSSWNTLDVQLRQAATASQACTAPGAAPAGFTYPTADFPTAAKLQMDILAMALACDLTRVASLQFSTATSQVTHSHLGSTQTDNHHNYSHNGPHSLWELGVDLYNPAAGVISAYGASLNQLLAIDLWYTQQVYYLADQLNKIALPGSKTLLDQTVICWGNELDLGAAHNHDDTPFVLIGGAGGRLRTNQVIRFPMKLDADSSTASIVNRNHNDLLITLGRVMGVNMNTFGTTSYCTGPITQILT